jgi:hypothetical protein
MINRHRPIQQAGAEAAQIPRQGVVVPAVVVPAAVAPVAPVAPAVADGGPPSASTGMRHS